MDNKIQQFLVNAVASFDVEKLQEALNAQVKDTVEQALKAELGPFGQFYDKVRKEISAQAAIGVGNISLTEYNKLIGEQLQTALDGSMQHYAKQAAEALAKQLESAAPAKIKLSELLARFIESNQSYAEVREWKSISCYVEFGQDSFERIYLDQEPGKDKYQCAFRLRLYERKIFGLLLEGVETEKYYFQRFPKDISFLFALYCREAEIEVDLGEFEICDHLNYPEPEPECDCD